MTAWSLVSGQRQHAAAFASLGVMHPWQVAVLHRHKLCAVASTYAEHVLLASPGKVGCQDTCPFRKQA